MFKYLRLIDTGSHKLRYESSSGLTRNYMKLGIINGIDFMNSEITGQFYSSWKILIFLSTENERVEVLEKMKILINYS